MVDTALLAHFSMLRQLEPLSIASVISVMIKPDAFHLPEDHLLVQEVPTEGMITLLPRKLTELPGMVTELKTALAIVSSYSEDDSLCLLYNPIDLIISDKHVLTQRVIDNQIILETTKLSDLKDDSVIHITQVFSPSNRKIEEFTIGRRARMEHVCGSLKYWFQYIESPPIISEISTIEKV